MPRKEDKIIKFQVGQFHTCSHREAPENEDIQEVSMSEHSSATLPGAVFISNAGETTSPPPCEEEQSDVEETLPVSTVPSGDYLVVAETVAEPDEENAIYQAAMQGAQKGVAVERKKINRVLLLCIALVVSVLALGLGIVIPFFATSSDESSPEFITTTKAPEPNREPTTRPISGSTPEPTPGSTNKPTTPASTTSEPTPEPTPGPNPEITTGPTPGPNSATTLVSTLEPTAEPTPGVTPELTGGSNASTTIGPTFEPTQETVPTPEPTQTEPTTAPSIVPSFCCSVSSDFGFGDEGWGTAKGAVNDFYFEDAGYICAEDKTDGNYWYFQAPTKFKGDKSGAYGYTLRYDLKQSATTSPGAENPDIIIEGDGAYMTFDFHHPPGIEWTRYSVTISSGPVMYKYGSTVASGGLWLYADDTPTTGAEAHSILSNVTNIYILGEYRYGYDVGCLDNVKLDPTPIT